MKTESKNNKNLWNQCQNCKQIIYHRIWKESLSVCIKCNYHHRIAIQERILTLCDSFKVNNEDFSALDPLKFVVENQSYIQKLSMLEKKLQRKESVICGRASIDKIYFHLVIMDFAFLGGSLGSVTGEKIILQINEAIRYCEPLVILSASGGARMQEGIYSLVQMSRILARLYQFKEKKLLYISILSDPTMGGVTASYASLGDLILAEPNALIGFAGPRVIEKTIQEKLPDNFQKSEFLLEKGFVDRIVERKNLKKELKFYFKFFNKQ